MKIIKTLLIIGIILTGIVFATDIKQFGLDTLTNLYKLKHNLYELQLHNRNMGPIAK